MEINSENKKPNESQDQKPTSSGEELSERDRRNAEIFEIFETAFPNLTQPDKSTNVSSSDEQH